MYSSMRLSRQQFLERRRRLLGLWRYAGPGLIAAILDLGIYLWITAPMLINPFAVGDQLASGEMEPELMSVSALMLPVVVLLLLGLLLLLVLFAYVAFSNERRYLRILDSHMNDKE